MQLHVMDSFVLNPQQLPVSDSPTMNKQTEVHLETFKVKLCTVIQFCILKNNCDLL